MEQGAELSGLKVLVVEDEPLIAMGLKDLLTDSGCTVADPASSVEQGMRLIEQEAVDGAILDVNLRGEMVFPLADALAEQSIPFVYMTGYGKLLRACNHGRPVLQKPYNNYQLLGIIGQWRPRVRPAATGPCVVSWGNCCAEGLPLRELPEKRAAGCEYAPGQSVVGAVRRLSADNGVMSTTAR